MVAHTACSCAPLRCSCQSPQRVCSVRPSSSGAASGCAAQRISPGMLSSRCHGPMRTVVRHSSGSGFSACSAISSTAADEHQAGERDERQREREAMQQAATLQAHCAPLALRAVPPRGSAHLRNGRAALIKRLHPRHRAPRAGRAAERGRPEPRRRVDEVLVVRIDDALAHAHPLAAALGDEAAPQASVGVALQLRLLDAVAQAAETVAGRVQRARRPRHVAQHPHAAVGREASDVARKALGETLLHRGQCQRAQRVALPDARPLVRRRRAARHRHGRGPPAATARRRSARAACQRGHCSASQRRAAATRRGLRMANAARVAPAPTPRRTPRPAPRGRSPRATAAPAPAGATRRRPARCCAARCRATRRRPPAAAAARRRDRRAATAAPQTHAVK